MKKYLRLYIGVLAILIEVYRIQNPEYNNTSIAKGTTDPRH